MIFVPVLGHIFNIFGGSCMTREYHFGKTKIVIHSPLANMESVDRLAWFEKNKDTNPHLLRLRAILWEDHVEGGEERSDLVREG